MNTSRTASGLSARTRRRAALIATLALPLSLMTAPAIAQSLMPTATLAKQDADTSTPTRVALAQAKKNKKRVEIEGLRSETGTYYANPDGKTLTAEVSSAPVRVKKNGDWQPIDPTLIEEDGVLRPKSTKGDLALSLGGDKHAVIYSGGKGKVYISAPAILPKPVVKDNIATYTDAYGTGADLVISSNPNGFRHEIVLRQRPTQRLRFRIPIELPAGFKLGEASDKTPRVLNSKGKEVANLPSALMLDATEKREPATGRLSQAKTSVDGDGNLVLAPDGDFLADPAVTYPITLAAPLEDWTGTGIAGDTFVSHSYPSSASNKSLNRIIVGRSNNGTVTWRGYINFNIKSTPLAGGTVHNADLRLFNYDTNDCSDTTTAGIVVRRVTSQWDINTMTWGSGQPEVTPDGQYGNKGAYGVDCPEGEGELYYSIEDITQAWMDGADDYGVQLSSASESVPTNWRWYRSDEYGGYDTYPFTPRGPVLFIQYEPALEEFDFFEQVQDPDAVTAEEIISNPLGIADSPTVPSPASATEGSELDASSPWTAEGDPSDLQLPPEATADEIAATDSAEGRDPGFPDGVIPTLPPTTPPPDTAPTVTTTKPEENATAVDTNTNLVATFSEPVTSAQLSLKDASGAEHNGSLETGPSGAVLRFTPSEALQPETTYTASLSNAKDATGNAMNSYSWSFTTGTGTPDADPVGHWTFDEGTGQLAGDSSDRGHDASLSPTAEWIDGKYGGAISNTVSSTSPATAANTQREMRINASQTAAKQKKPVEVASETTETRITYAQPDGHTFKTEITSGPVRTKKGDQWVAIDTSLKKNGKILAPGAISSGMRLKISNGGDGLLARMSYASGEVYALRWPTDLPQPTIKGNAATYANAAGRGADLVVTVLPTGFRHDIVLRERRNSPLELRIGVETGGLKLTEQKGGSLLLTGRNGKPIASAARSLLRDGIGKGQIPLTKSGEANTDLVTKDGQTEWVFKPDQAFLADTGTTYPVRLAATVTLPLGADVDVYNGDVDWPAYPSSSSLMAGTATSGIKARAHLQFDTTGLQGSTVTDATLSMNAVDSHDCGASLANGIQVARLTSAWAPDSLYWDEKPTHTTEDASTNFKGVNQDCAPWPDTMDWNVTGIAQDWATGSANYGLVLKSPGEANVNNYRIFTSSEDTDYNLPPKLTITTSDSGSTPTVTNMAITPAQVVAGTTVTSSLTPVLSATVADTAGGNLTAEFEVEHDPAATGQGSGRIWNGRSNAVASGNQANITIPAGKLADGWKVRWRTRAISENTSTASAWSEWQTATVDLPEEASEPLARTTGPVLRTDQSFTIAAWTRWLDGDSAHSIAEQRGTNQSPFQLGSDPDHGLVFTLTDADSATATSNGAVSDVEAPVGEWFHLTGVYDSALDKATLYLNGEEVKSQVVSFSAWNSAGLLALGVRLNGDLDDTRAYQRALTSTEVAALPTSTTAIRRAATQDSWQPDGISFDECRSDNKPWFWQKRDDNLKNRPGGWNKNRFSWCYWTYLPIGYYQINGFGDRVPTELLVARMTLIGESTSLSRTFKVKARLDDFNYKVPRPVPRITRSTVIALTAESTGSDYLGRPVNATNVGRSCQAQGAQKTDGATWSLWQSGYQAEFLFTSPKNATSDWQFIHQCKVSFGVQMSGGPYTAIPYVNTTIKCDSAPYITHFGFKEGGCVFKGITPSAVNKLGAGYDAAFRHYEFIYDHPQLTIPQWSDEKEFKGLTEDGGDKPKLLKRSGYEGADGINRKAARKECAAKWGPNYSGEFGQPDPDGIVDNVGIQGDCDEYPFNATYDGVGYQSARGDRNFSVAVINGPEQQYHGSLLNRWFARERVIDGDGFYLRLMR